MKRPFLSLALLFLVAVPVVAVPALAFALLSVNGQSAGPALAQGSIGGSFHPVAGSFEPDTTELSDCGRDFGCLEQAFGNLAYRDGPKPALRLFDERIASDRNVEAGCHRIAHAIGSAAFASYHRNVAKTFSQGSATCASGYYHGIVERAFLGTSSKARLGKVARSLCLGQGIRRRGFLDYQCRHGLGHGLMIQTGYDLPLALSLCGRLGTRWDEVTCTSGVFMENANTSFGFRSRWLEDDDPLYPCNSIEQRHRRSCYLRSTTRILRVNDNDWKQTAETCPRLDPTWIRFCFRSYGRDAAAQARYVSRRTLALCSDAGAGEADCLYGAARSIADTFEGGRRAAVLCDRAPRTAREACFSGLGVVLGLLNPTDAGRVSACARITEEYVQACSTAAIAEVSPSGREAWG